jgi:hypothetical protein
VARSSPMAPSQHSPPSRRCADRTAGAVDQQALVRPHPRSQVPPLRQKVLCELDDVAAFHIGAGCRRMAPDDPKVALGRLARLFHPADQGALDGVAERGAGRLALGSDGGVDAGGRGWLLLLLPNPGLGGLQAVERLDELQDDLAAPDS